MNSASIADEVSRRLLLADDEQVASVAETLDFLTRALRAEGRDHIAVDELNQLAATLHRTISEASND